MSDNYQYQNGSLADEEKKLEELEREEAVLESGPHDGFADASRVVRLESEVEALDQRIEREKQRAIRGQG